MYRLIMLKHGSSSFHAHMTSGPGGERGSYPSRYDLPPAVNGGLWSYCLSQEETAWRNAEHSAKEWPGLTPDQERRMIALESERDSELQLIRFMKAQIELSRNRIKQCNEFIVKENRDNIEGGSVEHWPEPGCSCYWCTVRPWWSVQNVGDSHPKGIACKKWVKGEDE